MVERHAQQLVHGELLLHGQCQQVGQVLGCGGAHFGALQAAGGAVGIHMQGSTVALGGAGAALVGKADSAGDGVGAVQVGQALAHHGHLRIAKNNGQRCAALKACGCGGCGYGRRCRSGRRSRCQGAGHGVDAGNVAFVGGFVQQRHLCVGVARQKHGQVTDLLGLRVDGGHAAFVQRHAQGFQSQVFDVGHAAHGGDDLVHHHAVGAAADLDAARHLAQLGRGAGVQQHFLLEQGGQLGVEGGVFQAGQVGTGGEGGHLNAQAGQRLRNLHANHSHADHGHARAQRGLLEQGVGGEDAVAKGQPFIRHAGARAGGDDDAARGVGGAVNVYRVGA